MTASRRLRPGVVRRDGRGFAGASVALAVALCLAGCGDDTPAPRSFPPLHFDYLTPLRLNVASIQVEDHSVPASAADLAPLSPQPPALALGTMAQERLVAAGTSGKAVFVIDDASLTREPGQAIDGRMAVHLDIITSGGVRAAYAEARVSRQRTGIGPNEDQGGVLYDMTKQMMDDMNVEFEFQVRRTLREWLMVNSAAPTPVSAAPIVPQASPVVPAMPPVVPLAPPVVPDAGAPTMSPPPGVLTAPPGVPPAF